MGGFAIAVVNVHPIVDGLGDAGNRINAPADIAAFAKALNVEKATAMAWERSASRNTPGVQRGAPAGPRVAQDLDAALVRSKTLRRFQTKDCRRSIAPQRPLRRKTAKHLGRI